jgi:hypothetical protein
LGDTDTVILPETIVIASVVAWLCTGVLESLTVNVSETPFAEAVGVPVIVPVPPFSVRPAGNVPLVSVHV